MIPANDVTDAILAVLRGTGGDALPVGDHTAPNPAPSLYGVLETPPGGIDAGSLGEPGDAITPDDLADRWRRWHNFDVIFEGTWP